LFPAADDVGFVVCGPRGLTKFVVKTLKEMGWDKNIVLFY